MFRAEDQRRRIAFDLDGRIVREVMLMSFCTVGNRIENGRVVGEGPYAGVSEAEALEAFASRNYLKALARIEAMKRKGGILHA